MATDAIRRAVKKYDAETAVQFHLKLNKKTDAEIIAKLKSVEKVQTYLKELIAADIEHDKKEIPLPFLVVEVIEIDDGAEGHEFHKYCPKCKSFFGWWYPPKHCPSCGQRIDVDHGEKIGTKTIDHREKNGIRSQNGSQIENEPPRNLEE